MNTSIKIGVISGLIGVLIGWLVWGHRPYNQPSMMTMHQVPDGSMMSNGGMDMKSMMQDMNAGLVGKTGDEFDKAFLSEMIVHIAQT
jgi:uncharacterized protein (DUF305 family)